jgi:hypothetical protein
MRYLDSAEGINALERNLGKAVMEKFGRAGILSAYQESWSHPWLAAWARKSGFVDCHSETLCLEDATGHWDHAPYALNSVSGKSQITDCGTAENGPVYFVIWDAWVKGVTIMGQVETAMDRLFTAKYAWRPSWAQSFRTAAAAVRHGLASMEDPGLLQSATTKEKAVQEGAEALAALTGTLGETILAWPNWSQDDREQIAGQLARVKTLAGLLPMVHQAVA